MTQNQAGDFDINWAVDSGQFTITPTAITASTGYVHTEPGYQTTWWQGTWHYQYQAPDKFGTAFKIAQKLMEAGVVNVKNDVAKFVKLVNIIAGEM